MPVLHFSQAQEQEVPKLCIDDEDSFPIVFYYYFKKNQNYKVLN